MPEHASSRFAAALFDQQSEEHRIADWGGDDLFTRMPEPPVVDDAPAPRFRPALALVDAPEDRRRVVADDDWDGARDRRRAAGSAEAAMRERAERLALAVVEPPVAHVSQWQPDPADGWDRGGSRPSKVITGRPDAAPRPAAATVASRRRPARTPAEWVGPRPERIMAWAFALGLLLILVAISTADAAAL